MRIVIKIGTSSLTHATGKLNLRRIDELARVISDLKNAGHEILLVSSGAIAMGVSKLKLPSRPSDVPTKQAAAAVGQCELMYIYDRMFLQYGQTVAQILLTLDTVDYPDRRANTENTLFRLLEMGVIPIINENDTVSTEEFSVGDNDTLGAKIACLVGADLLHNPRNQARAAEGRAAGECRIPRDESNGCRQVFRLSSGSGRTGAYSCDPR